MTFEKSVVVPLDPEATFDLITQPDRLRRWMAVAARVELRPGGDYRWTVTPGHTAAGTIVDVEPGKRVVYTWGWEDGDPAPGGSTVTVTLTPVDAGTEVRLAHDGLTEEQAADAGRENRFRVTVMRLRQPREPRQSSIAIAPRKIDLSEREVGVRPLRLQACRLPQLAQPRFIFASQ